MDSLFVPGAKVVIAAASGSYVGEIEKVYKSGNFVIKGSKQQWRGDKGSSYASETGDAWIRRSLHVITDQNRNELLARVALTAKTKRLEQCRRAMDAKKVRDVTDEQLAALETILGIKAS